MSKFFFKGRIDKRENYGANRYETKRAEKPGSEDFPLNVCVQSDERRIGVEAILSSNSLFANIEVNPDSAENLSELDGMLNTPQTIVLQATPGRNDPCSCGSGKKYKKCCG